MKTSTWLLAASMSAALAAGACGGGGGSGGSTGSGGSKSSSATAGSGGGAITNTCTEAMAEDDTGKTAVTITFGGTSPGLHYAPNCLKVKTSTMVTFSGDFTSHPLSGGVSGTKDATSPISETTTGMTATFTMTKAGTYGFFCEIHQALGMEGAIYVQ